MAELRFISGLFLKGPKSGSIWVERLVGIGLTWIYIGLSEECYGCANFWRRFDRSSLEGNISVAFEPRLVLERKGCILVERLWYDPQVSVSVGQRLS